MHHFNISKMNKCRVQLQNKINHKKNITYSDLQQFRI